MTGTKKKKKQLQKQLEIAEKEFENEMNKFLEDSELSVYNFEKYEEKLLPFKQQIINLQRELRYLQEPEWSNLTDYGDLMTLEVFIENVLSGSLIDYDGYGYYSDGTKMTDILIIPSDVKYNVIRKEFSHVMWFNR